MGKASKWIVNFLLGKKEDRTRRKEMSYVEEDVGNSAAMVPCPCPNIRRRWSFGRSSSSRKEKGCHRSSKSVDLVTKNHHSLDVKTIEMPKEEIDEESRAVICRLIQHSAATKIQTCFRSYLARKALHALKGLVKLQAVVRGYIVRKQTTAILRQMHALMSIQARARFHRIHMAHEETPLFHLNKNHYYSNNNGYSTRPIIRQATDAYGYKAQAVSKTKNVYLDHSQFNKLEQGVNAYFSGDVTYTKTRTQYQYQYDNFSSSTSHNNHTTQWETPNPIPGRASISGDIPCYLLPLPNYHDQLLGPNYMANTESSRAKVRSQSEPKRRPGSNPNAKGTRTTSMDRTGVPQTQHQSLRLGNRNQDPWSVKVYRSKKIRKDNESDANSTTSCDSTCRNSILGYEPHLTMY